MKNTHVSRSGGRHARYDAEYKREALKLWRSSGRSAAKVAAELGIRAPLLYRWARAEREPRVKNASANAVAQPDVASLQAEVERLRAENAKLLEQREVLKKSLGILSEPPPRGMPGSPR
jgi:transposase